MADMFGTPIGARLAEQDELRRLQQGVNVSHELAQMAQIPGQAREREARTRFNTLQGDKLQTEILQEQKMQELLGGAKLTGDLTKDFEWLAKNAMSAGLVTKAKTFADAASQLALRTAQGNARNAAAEKAALEAQLKQVDQINKLFGGVKDQAGMDYANALFTLQTGMPSPYARVPYSVEFVGRINDSLMSAKEKAELALRKLDVDSKVGARNAGLDIRRQLLDIRRSGERLAREREARLAKGGAGKAVSGPNKGEIDQAERLVRQDFPEIQDGTTAAYTLASEARELRQKNPALGASQALQLAYAEAVRRGDFKTTESGFLFKDKKTKFVNQGKTAETAMTVPAKKEELVNGRYYVSPATGAIGKWNGSTFIPVKSGPGRISVGRLRQSSADVDEDLGPDDDEDDE